MNTFISQSPDTNTSADPWEYLKVFTEARIAIGRCGVSPPIKAILDFKLAHAQARDAVHCRFESDDIAKAIGEFHSTLLLQSNVAGREEYLSRPDLGRMLSDESEEKLKSLGKETDLGYDVCVVVGDGLSARSIHENAVSFVQKFVTELKKTSYSVAPVCVVENARVAISDSIGELLEAKLVVILIGERPGLSSPNSMGAYLTYEPELGKTDESRNCISNIREGGLSIESGVQKLSYLVEQALLQKRTGVLLKDLMESKYLPFTHSTYLKGDE